MLWFKKKKKIVEVKNERFVIPQIQSPYQGIKKTRDGFVPSTFSSAIFGTGLNDKAKIHDSSKELGDTRRKYDSFRDPKDRKVSDDELIQKYGTKYPEFHQIDIEQAKRIYGEDFEFHKKEDRAPVVDTNKKAFSFIESKDDNKASDIKEEVPPVKNFDFSFEKEEPKEDDNPFQRFTNLKVGEDVYKSSLESKFNNNGEYKTRNSAIVRKSDNQSQTIFDDPKFNHPIEKDINMYPSHHKEIEEDNKFNTYQEVEPAPVTNNNYQEDSFEESEPEVSYIEPTTLEMPSLINPYKDYQLPPLSLLSHHEDENEELPAWIEEKKQIINDTLNSFAISGEVAKYVLGPTFTRYEILLETGVNVRKILSIEDNLQMNLGVKSIRIQAPIPGKRTVGIEVPNEKRKTVFYGDTLSESFINDNKPLSVVVGKDIDGNIIETNIAKWPHGLIAGGTGSGKSVCINTIITSLLLKNKPNQVRFIMIDPKQVELSVYNDLPHMITPVISDPKMASTALKWAVNEMERRFTQFSSVRARDISSYNEKTEEDPTLQKMCYIVIVIDELADLMMTCGQDVEDSIQRITQKARAAGIHLIVATQRPTVDVVKGTIKANIQARLAFRVNSQVDSTTILDEVGAENLLGYGDMLLKEVDFAKRVQGSYIPDSDIDAVVDFICNEAQPDYQLTHKDLEESNETASFGGLTTNEESPDLIYQIAVWCVENQSCSINSLTQAFSLGFNRAQRIVQTLETMGIISERKGTKRDILMDLNQINDLFEKGE